MKTGKVVYPVTNELSADGDVRLIRERGIAESLETRVRDLELGFTALLTDFRNHAANCSRANSRIEKLTWFIASAAVAIFVAVLSRHQ
jgi:hypothetical protein